MAFNPDNLEAKLTRGEALLHLERHQEALEIFTAILKANPVHALAHLGAAQARSYAGGNPCPHLDAAVELNREAALSVLRETFDYRVLRTPPGETTYPLEELPTLLGVTAGEVGIFLEQHGLPQPGRPGPGSGTFPVGLHPEPLSAPAHRPALARAYSAAPP